MSETKKRVVITGASSGIGKALAFEFARNGYNVFLTARSKEKLSEVAKACEEKFSVKTEVYGTDLASQAAVGNLVEEILKSRIDVLVNNAGFGVKGDFAETNIDDELKMLDVQLVSMLRLTKALLPKMIAQKSGKILNVASVYSFAPVPKQSVYGASKSFILNFSTALQNELKEKNIQVSVVCPGITQTEFRTRAGIADKKDSGMSAERVAEISFAQMMKGKHLIVPGWQNKIFVSAAKHLPSGLFAKLMRIINDRRNIN